MTTIDYKEKYEEYHSKFWAGYHTNNELTKENRKLMMRLDIYEKRVLYGEIKRISHHYDYGILTNSEYGDIFFHSSQCKFNISNILLGKKVKFNLTISKKIEAINVELILGDISNIFDILETGIYKSDSFQIDESSDNTSDESSDNTSDDNTSNDNTSDTSGDNISEDNSTNMLLNTVLNNNILPEDNYEEDLKIIHNARKIWYMNCRLNYNDQNHVNSWSNSIDNGFVGTWQKNKVNQKLCQKLVIGDIIAWYIVGMGYSAILRVKDSCSLMNKDDLKIHYPEKSEEDIKNHLEWENRENCRIIKIPVEFLAYTDLNKCIKRMEGWSKEDWTSGFRGPNAISPKHPRWKEQVMKIYKNMK
jgi:cold shock CspA family protein